MNLINVTSNFHTEKNIYNLFAEQVGNFHSCPWATWFTSAKELHDKEASGDISL